ncbi:MAG: hypothetical protein ABEK50_00870 [bacterium]
MSSELVETDKLHVILGAPDRQTIVINPEVGRKIDLWKQEADMNLYLDMEEFIDASDDCRDITLSQENDFEKGAIRIKNQLKKDLDQPDNLKIYRKLDNIFLKPC